MDRVHQGLAFSVFPVEPVKIIAADLKGRDPSGCVLDPDAAQVTAFAEEKGTDEDVRGLVMFNVHHPLKTKKVKPNHWLPYTQYTTSVNTNHDTRLDFFAIEG